MYALHDDNFSLIYIIIKYLRNYVFNRKKNYLNN